MTQSRTLARLRTTVAACSLTATLAATGASAAIVSRAVEPMYGRISAFYGSVTAMYGRISPFYGRISPFYGDVTGFWNGASPFVAGTTSSTSSFYGKNYDPFWGSGPGNPFAGAVAAPAPTGPAGAPATTFSYANIAGFWKTETANWTNIEAAWANADSTSDATKLASMIQNSMINPAVSFWGAAVKKGAPPPPGTGGPDKPGVAKPTDAFAKIFTDAGVKFNADGSINAASLLSVDKADQAMLYLNFYDKLMDYSGTGHVDWWMGAVHWSPALAQTEGTVPGGGSPPTVGMLDFVVSSDKHTPKQVTQFGSTENNGHGAAVGSLIMGSLDGSGVLGILPPDSVNVVVYDPYDASDTTDWSDIGVGVKTLATSIFKGKTVPVGVLNASLGIPGWTLNQGWNDALQTAGAHGHDLVIAAGNDGSTQKQNITWNFAKNPTILVVGSVGLDGTISPFSNRPGEACLIDSASSSGTCSESNKLKYHFIVAPGEFILVSDGKGGHTRQSGTSLAAPLVSGAIALLQNRWPWLSKYSDETAQIILKSATPLGTHPGADPVYGVGELNIAASQSPLNWSNLEYHTVKNGKVSATATSATSVMSMVKSGTQSSFDSSQLYFTAIEHVGNTYRDFQIPLSSKLVGQKVKTAAGDQLFQTYLSAALRQQASKLIDGSAEVAAVAPLSFQSDDRTAPQLLGMGFKISMSFGNTNAGFRTGDTPYQTDASLAGDRFGVRFGFGDGAPALDEHAAFGFHSDYDLTRGGASPLLGLASGGAYVGGRVALASRLNLSVGMTDRNDIRDLAGFGVIADQQGLGVRRYRAQAQQASIDYAVTEGFGLRASVTALHEDDGLLGTQSLDASDLSGGSATHGITVGFDGVLGHGFALSGAGTLATTHSGAGQLTTGSAGLRSASAELALVKRQLFGQHDSVRLALSMPLHTIGGNLHYANYGVVDRETGALGILDEVANPGSGKVPVAAELMYGRVTRRAGEFSLFGRVDANSQSEPGIGFATGGQLRLAF